MNRYIYRDLLNRDSFKMWIWSVSLFEVVVGIFDPSLWDNIYMFYKRVYIFPMRYVNLDIKKLICDDDA